MRSKAFARSIAQQQEKVACRRSERIRSGQEAYRRTLDAYVPRSLLPHSDARVLSIGCGIALDAAVHASFVEQVPLGKESGRLPYTGIDIRKEYIDLAKETNPRYRFINGDAKQLGAYVDGPFDIVFAAHPETSTRLVGWNHIMEATLPLLTPNATIVSTFYFSDELACMAEDLWRDFGFLAAAKNPSAVPHWRNPLMMVHQYVLVAQRGAKSEPDALAFIEECRSSRPAVQMERMRQYEKNEDFAIPV